MRGTDEYGIVTRNAEMRTKYAAFSYSAPVCLTPPRPRPPVEPSPQAVALMKEVADIVDRRRIEKARTAFMTKDRILAVVSAVTGVPIYLMLQPDRKSQEIAYSRWLSYWLITQLLPKFSYKAIGRALGPEDAPKDHSSVISGLRRFAALRDSAPFNRWLADERIIQLMKSGGTP